MNNIRLAITGHRPQKLGGFDMAGMIKRAELKEAIRKQFEIIRPDLIISGMALGVDQDAVDIALDMGIPYLAAIPCKNQEKFWPEHIQKTYQFLLRFAQDVVYVHDGPYTKDCMWKRNLWMLDHCNALLAVYNGDPIGGTAHCYNAARKKGIPIYRIIPQDVWKEQEL